MPPADRDSNESGLPHSKESHLAVAQHNEDTHVSATELAPEARRGADSEYRMSLMQAIKKYPKAVGWSVLLSSTLIMKGYDLALVGNLYASPMFN